VVADGAPASDGAAAADGAPAADSAAAADGASAADSAAASDGAPAADSAAAADDGGAPDTSPPDDAAVPPDAPTVDPCLVDNGGCDVHATCTAAGESRTCTCNAGYQGDGFTCTAEACVPATTPTNDGHGPGTDCMGSGCHGPGEAGGGILVTAVGTVYSSASGGTPVAGANILLTDSEGRTAQLVSSPNGVFWIGNCSGRGWAGNCCTASSLWGGGPETCIDNFATTQWVSVTVTKCPDRAPMQSAANGHCGSCHTGDQQMHLP